MSTFSYGINRVLNNYYSACRVSSLLQQEIYPRAYETYPWLAIYSTNWSQTIKQLQEESTIPEYAFNLFCFIHTSDQEEVQVKGTPPAEDIMTGFEGQNETQIRQSFHQFLAQRGTMGKITRVWFAVLDSQSAARSTIVLHHSMKKSLWDEIHAEVPETPIPGQHEICDDGNIWWKWRVPFRYAWETWNSISNCDFEVLELYSRPEYLDSDGVVDAETCDKIVNGITKDPKGLV